MVVLWCRNFVNAIKRLSTNQTRRQQHQRNFLGGGISSALKWLKVAIAHYLYRTIENVDMCTEPELLEVKVPIVFLATREGLESQIEPPRPDFISPYRKLDKAVEGTARNSQVSTNGFHNTRAYTQYFPRRCTLLQISSTLFISVATKAFTTIYSPRPLCMIICTIIK